MAYQSKHTGANIDNKVDEVNELQNRISNLENNLTSTILNTIYPIGSLYTSFNNINPASIIGGTWIQIKDCFLISAGGSYAVGTSGGSINHTHNYGLQFGGFYTDTIIEADSNAGVLKYDSSGNITLQNAGTSIGSYTAKINGGCTANHGSEEKSMAHYRMIGDTSYTSSLPPYKAIYMWQRTA